MHVLVMKEFEYPVESAFLEIPDGDWEDDARLTEMIKGYWNEHLDGDMELDFEDFVISKQPTWKLSKLPYVVTII